MVCLLLMPSDVPFGIWWFDRFTDFYPQGSFNSLVHAETFLAFLLCIEVQLSAFNPGNKTQLK